MFYDWFVLTLIAKMMVMRIDPKYAAVNGNLGVDKR